MSINYHDQEIRYARNISLPEIGMEGQERLLRSKVLIVGAGGLGSPLLLYLAAAGVGTIGIIDDDVVALSNLQRQIIHETGDLNRPKVESAADALYDLNPQINIITHKIRLDSGNIDKLLEDYDIVADGCDNFPTRFLLNAGCMRHKKPLVSAAVMGFGGQLYSFKPFLPGNNPCYQCLYPKQPPDDAMPSCSESGILGAVAGIMGSWQAAEVIKELLNIGDSLSGYVIIFDVLTATMRKVKLKRDPECPACNIYNFAQ